jgi:hypothetical protein
MSQLKINLPGQTNPESCEHTAERVNFSGTKSTALELRILQDGRVYRSKAEMERLIVLGQWHHRRQRRRQRLRF